MSKDKKQKLWEEYSKKRTLELQEKIILEYSGLVKIVAGRLSIYLGKNVEYDDLVGYGIFGLIDAIDKFDYKKGIKFETYASLRIRGSILDHIRKMDWIPRSVRQKQKKIDSAMKKFEAEFGKQATDEELADELELTMEELANWQTQTNLTNISSLDDYMDKGLESKIEYKSDKYINPEKIIDRNETKKILLETLEYLTKNEKTVIILYYYEELTLKEISKVLEVSESRISQLHSKALSKMKEKLGNNFDILTSY
ncbi:MAG TPA: FliA/WhiG family RNA polymerase sigma factor [Clostridiales bacterium]|nr:FliA/WhiG family RNA polymerase sigma factor [Clostridiales bacterium]